MKKKLTWAIFFISLLSIAHKYWIQCPKISTWTKMWKELRARTHTQAFTEKTKNRTENYCTATVPVRTLASIAANTWKHYTLFIPLSLPHCVELKYTRMPSAAEAAQQPTEFTDYKMCLCEEIFAPDESDAENTRAPCTHNREANNNNNKKTKKSF